MHGLRHYKRCHANVVYQEQASLQGLQQYLRNPACTQVDAVLQLLSQKNAYSFEELLARHQPALLTELAPSHDSVRPVQQLAAFAQLLLPWTVVLSAVTSAATNVKVTKPQEEMSWWPKRQVNSPDSVYTGALNVLLKECESQCIAKLECSTCTCMHVDCIVCMTSVMSKGLYCSYPGWHCKAHHQSIPCNLCPICICTCIWCLQGFR